MFIEKTAHPPSVLKKYVSIKVGESVDFSLMQFAMESPKGRPRSECKPQQIIRVVGVKTMLGEVWRESSLVKLGDKGCGGSSQARTPSGINVGPRWEVVETRTPQLQQRDKIRQVGLADITTHDRRVVRL